MPKENSGDVCCFCCSKHHTKRKMKINFEKNKLIFIFICIIIVGITFALNHFEPYYADDLNYMKIYNTEKPLKTIGDVFISQINHYKLWNGRTVVHTIDQLFMLSGDKVYFDIANTVVTVFLLSIIYTFCMGKNISNSFLLFAFSFLFFCSPSIGEVLVWQTGACNYLWGSFLLLIFFLPYLRYLIFLLSSNSELVNLNSGGNVRTKVMRVSSILSSIGMGLLGVLAGWTIEAGSSMILFGIGLILLIQAYFCTKRQSHFFRPKAWEIVGFVSAILGFGLLIFAPGQRVRQHIVYEEIEQYNWIGDIVYRLARETFYMVIWLSPIMIATIFAFLIVKNKNEWKDFVWKYSASIICGLMALCGVYVMTFSVGYATRVLFTPLIILLIAFGLFYKDIKGKYENILSLISVMFSFYVMTHLVAAIVLMYKTGEPLNFGFNYVGNIRDMF